MSPSEHFSSEAISMPIWLQMKQLKFATDSNFKIFVKFFILQITSWVVVSEFSILSGEMSGHQPGYDYYDCCVQYLEAHHSLHYRVSDWKTINFQDLSLGYNLWSPVSPDPRLPHQHISPLGISAACRINNSGCLLTCVIGWGLDQ